MNFNVTQKHSHYLSLYVRRNGKWIFLNDRFLICDGFFFSVFWFLYWLSFFCCRPRSVLGCRSWYGRRWWMFSIRSSLGPTGNVRPISNQSTRTKADPLPFFVSRITIRVSILPSSSFSTFRWRHYGPFFFQPEGLPYGHWLRRPRWRHRAETAACRLRTDFFTAIGWDGHNDVIMTSSCRNGRVLVADGTKHGGREERRKNVDESAHFFL